MAKKIIVGFFVFLLLILSALYIPVEWAVKDEKLGNEHEYIVVENTDSYYASWIAIGNENGRFESDKWYYVEFTGNKPLGRLNYDIYSAQNLYVCYGSFTGSEERSGDSKGVTEEVKIFNVTDWAPVYPIKRITRDPKGIFPISYTNILDYWGP